MMNRRLLRPPSAGGDEIWHCFKVPSTRADGPSSSEDEEENCSHSGLLDCWRELTSIVRAELFARSGNRSARKGTVHPALNQ